MRISDWSSTCARPISRTEPIERRVSETILENVRVLAIDQTVDENASEPSYASNFTLEVTPKQAEMVSVVRELGALSISLRSLAKDEEALERLVNRDPGEALPATNPHRGDTHTWDREENGRAPWRERGCKNMK